MEHTVKPPRTWQLLVGVAAGWLAWPLLRWLAFGPSPILAFRLGSQQPWMERVVGVRGTLIYLVAAWGLLLGWRKGMPSFVPLLLVVSAFAPLLARGDACPAIGAGCLLLGALVAQPQNLPVALRRCLALTIALVVVCSIAGF